MYIQQNVAASKIVLFEAIVSGKNYAVVDRYNS